jgi:hypothetical protein
MKPHLDIFLKKAIIQFYRIKNINYDIGVLENNMVTLPKP